MDLLSLFAQSESASFLKTSFFAALVLAAIVVVSFLLGRFVAKPVQMADSAWKFGVIFFCIIFSTYYVATNWPPKYGVDLAGGTIFVIDLSLDNDPEVVVDVYMRNDMDGDNKLTSDELPENLKSRFSSIDENDDDFLTEDEVRVYAIQDAAQSGGAKESVENVIEQLKKRIDPSGIYELDLRALGADQIEITIPGVESSESARILERIKKAGYLQFRILAQKSDSEHASVISDARKQAENPLIRTRAEVRSAEGMGDKAVARWVNVGLLDKQRVKQLGLDFTPFKYTLPFGQSGMLDCLVRNSATGELVEFIPYAPEGADPSSAAFKRYQNDQNLRSAWYAQWWNKNIAKGDANARLQILVIEPVNEDYNVEGQDLVPNLVQSTTDSRGRPAVEFVLKRDGVRKFAKLTGDNLQNSLGIILDGELLTAPSINSKIVKNGIIEGEFTNKEISDLISILKAGQLKTTLQSPDGGGDQIDSTMGQEMKDKGYWAIGASFILILAFLVVYYRIAGIVACIALILNLLMILAIIIMLKQPLTLNGLAGLVLTVGMSVDANVLIFERIREELAKDATLRMAIRNGFQRATTTIVDANITTFITAFILYVIGNEQLKSFSVALMLGIALSMFTAIFCSRVFFDYFEKKRILRTLGTNRMFSNSSINFIGKRGLAFAISMVFIVIGISAIVVRGGGILNHDLAGGSMARIVTAEKTDVEAVKKIVKKISDKVQVNGANAVVNVAKVNSQYPDGTEFRIESNIKKKGSVSLGELLKKEFGDKLAKPTVVYEISSSKMVSESTSPNSNGSNSNEAKSVDDEDASKSKTGEPAGDPCGGEDFSNGDLSDEDFTGGDFDPCGGDSSVGFQEEDKKSDTQEKTEAQTKSDPTAKSDTAKAAESGKADPAPSKEDSAEPKTSDPTTPDQSKADQSKADQADSAAKAAVSDDAAGVGGDPNEPQNSLPETTSNIRKFETTATINFGLSLKDANFVKKGVGLRNDFEDAARSLGYDSYTSNNIKVRDPAQGGDFVGDDVEAGAATWEVLITTQEPSHAEEILAEMKKRYTSEVFLPQAKEVGERFAQKAWLRALAAMVASLIGIVAYIWIRFQKVSFGLAAVVALIHDVLVVLGAIAVSFWLKDFLGIILVEDFKISLAVIAALLTIIGYSLNDTIVVFDRIREVRGKSTDLSGDMVNRSINQTLSRTILTSLTTFIVVLILYGAGGDAIHGFAFALVVGVIVGTYSSIFVASPVLLFLMKSETAVEPESESE